MGDIGVPFSHTGVQLLVNFEGNSNDASPNGFTGTDTNVTYARSNGKFLQGARFVQGDSSKVNYGTHTELVFDADFTINVWVYPESGQPDPYARVYDGGYYLVIVTDGGANNNGWVFELTQTIGLANTVDFGTWQMITASRIGSTLYLYKNGILFAQGTFSGTKGSGNFYLCSQSGTGRYATLRQDALYVLKGRGWTAQEVRQWYAWTKGLLV